MDAELYSFVQAVVDETIKTLENKRLLVTDKNPRKTAYKKTEQLLRNYNNFKRIVRDRENEIKQLREYGLPTHDGGIVQWNPHIGSMKGITVQDDTVDSAVQNVEDSVEGTVQAIAMIDRGMYALRNDPYYKVLEMRYFEGRTQEDIALEFDCSQKTISQHKTRLIKELSMHLFPDQIVDEILEN